MSEESPSEDTVELGKAIAQGWNIARVEGDPDSREALIEALTRRVAHMLRYDMDRLLGALYLLDISEGVYGKAMTDADSNRAGRMLAIAIVEREQEKLESRRRYQDRRGPEIEDCGSVGE